MKYRGFHISMAAPRQLSPKNFRLLFSSYISSTLPLRAGLTTLLVVSGASILLTNQANAGATHQEVNTSALMAQVPTSATIIYVNPENGVDTAGVGATEAAPYKLLLSLSHKPNQGQLFN
jgi:hypothetical protein